MRGQQAVVAILAIFSLGLSVQARTVQIIATDAHTGERIHHLAVWCLDCGGDSRSKPGAGWLDVSPGCHAVRIEARGYMGMTHGRLCTTPSSSTHTDVVLIPLGLSEEQLELANRAIRSPDASDPWRVQIHVDMPVPLDFVTIDVPEQIDVLMSNGTVETMDLEEYLKGVLPKEIGTSFPMEAMKAQAVAARSYAVQYYLTKGAICTTAQCQVWGPQHYDVTDEAVEATRGVVIAYEGKIVSGLFSASCGGQTISNEDAWGTTARPYFQGVPCIENKIDSCEQVCTPDIPKNDVCYGIWGHRVGLCQRGAQAMGKCGYDFIAILTHYYTDIDIANLPPTDVDDAQLHKEIAPSQLVTLPGSPFQWTWIMANTGDTTWSGEQGYGLMHVGGESFGVTQSVAMAAGTTVEPGQNYNWTLNLVAPAAPGSHTAYFQMHRNGVTFGQQVTAAVTVVESLPDPEPDTATDTGTFVDSGVDAGQDTTPVEHDTQQPLPDTMAPDTMVGPDTTPAEDTQQPEDTTEMAPDPGQQTSDGGGCSSATHAAPTVLPLFLLGLLLLLASLWRPSRRAGP